MARIGDAELIPHADVQSMMVFAAYLLLGVLAVPVMVLLMFMARRKDVMGRFVVGGPLYWLGWLSTLAMLLSVAAMGVGFFIK